MNDSPRPFYEELEEDDATLAAIDEGLRDAEAGRSVPAEQVRETLRQWTTTSTRNER